MYKKIQHIIELTNTLRHFVIRINKKLHAGEVML